MLNTETILRPKLQHFGLLTGNLQRLLDWYQKVLGMGTIHQSQKSHGCTRRRFTSAISCSTTLSMPARSPCASA
jgi:catechol 2,3-dioxygenase-like lactoylglutathione lyase family enzyme